MSIESVIPSNHLILCRPLLLLPSIFPSIRVFSNESVIRIRWPQYWSFSFRISPSNEYSGLISFRMDYQFSSIVQSCPTLCDPMNRSMPGLPVHHQLPEFTQTHIHQVSDAIQASHPLLSLFLLPSIFPSIRVFSNESVIRIRWPKYWIFSFNISPSSEYSGLISFRMDWLDLLAVQGALKSLLQHHSSKASILWCSAFLIVQLSYLYMTTGKNIALTTWIFVDKVISLLLNMLSRLVITFLPRSKHLLISWLQSPCAVILEPRKIKSAIVSTVCPSICHELMGLDAYMYINLFLFQTPFHYRLLQDTEYGSCALL